MTPPNMVNRTLTFKLVNAGLDCQSKTVLDAGDGIYTITAEYVANYDGRDYPASDPDLFLDTVSLQRLDANTVERVGKRRGRVVETAFFKVSKNNSELTVTVKGTVNGQDLGIFEGMNNLPPWLLAIRGTETDAEYSSQLVFKKIN